MNRKLNRMKVRPRAINGYDDYPYYWHPYCPPYRYNCYHPCFWYDDMYDVYDYEYEYYDNYYNDYNDHDYDHDRDYEHERDYSHEGDVNGHSENRRVKRKTQVPLGLHRDLKRRLPMRNRKGGYV